MEYINLLYTIWKFENRNKLEKCNRCNQVSSRFTDNEKNKLCGLCGEIIN